MLELRASGYKEWVKSIDQKGVCCWNDTHPLRLDGDDIIQPIPIPVDYDEMKKIYTVHGVACDLKCAKASIIEHWNFRTAHQLCVLAQMARDLFGRTEALAVAPPKHLLIRFGGYLTIQQYRVWDKSCYPVQAPFMSHPLVYAFESTETLRSEEVAGDEETDTGPTAFMQREAQPKTWRVQGLRIPQTPDIPGGEAVTPFKHPGLFSTYTKTREETEETVAIVPAQIKERKKSAEGNKTTQRSLMGTLTPFMKKK